MSNTEPQVFKFDIQYQEGVSVNWRFDFDSFEGLHYIHTGCYCTQLKEKGDNYIAGVLNIDHAMSAELRAKKGEHSVEKNISLYYDENEHEFIAGDMGIRTYNPNKKITTLILRGIVRVP